MTTAQHVYRWRLSIHVAIRCLLTLPDVHVCTYIIQLVTCIKSFPRSCFIRDRPLFVSVLALHCLSLPRFCLFRWQVEGDNDAFRGGCTGAVTRSLCQSAPPIGANVQIKYHDSFHSFLTNLILQCISYIGRYVASE